MAKVVLDTVGVNDADFVAFRNENGITAVKVGEANGNDVIEYSGSREALEKMIAEFFYDDWFLQFIEE